MGYLRCTGKHCVMFTPWPGKLGMGSQNATDRADAIKACEIMPLQPRHDMVPPTYDTADRITALLALLWSVVYLLPAPFSNSHPLGL